MNCKPGDLAVVIKESYSRHSREPVLGLLVEVIEAVTPGLCFTMPDGVDHEAVGPDRWLVRFQREVRIGRTIDDGTNRTRYAPLPDFVLRPIRDPGDDAVDEMLRPLPEPVTA